ncbi:MarR family winged helix-turn-helix transcriptional regulator [Oricola sp.]|uniref:MarR family winged helix-turn-helix transcriptional regulator n=1 Tax=Oricola sp. TaxID=1979950 RepID=UPI000C91AC05|nr:MarR family transcriptional regulator [Ahrensia sp.]MCK5747613.1 MarR family transcriptional regulator [Oricola sp.]|tara:strand:- start:72386 stop:72826 length:441 start_codon:yes stop_codon:yes gene_type:complete
MSGQSKFPYVSTLEVRDTCLCLHLQRTARTVARRFDEAFRPLGLTNGQYSLLMSLNRPEAPRMGDVAELLALDRTTLTANLKPLERRGLISIEPDPSDKRSRRLKLTEKGEEMLLAAYPIWKKTHAELDKLIDDPQRLRDELVRLA